MREREAREGRRRVVRVELGSDESGEELMLSLAAFEYGVHRIKGWIKEN